MPKTKQVNWQPISQMPLISAMIDTSLNDTREHLDTLSKLAAITTFLIFPSWDDLLLTLAFAKPPPIPP